MTFRDTGKSSGIVLLDDVEFHASLLADAYVDLMAFNCTAASLLAGPEILKRRIETATGIPATTTAAALVNALRAIGFGMLLKGIDRQSTPLR